MRMKMILLSALLVIGISAQAQLHLGKSETDLVASLGTEFTKVYDQNGNDVIAYYKDVKNHPKFGDYSLFSSYLFENNSCVMQQTVMPVSQKDELISGFNSLYEKVDDMTWKSKEGTYYILSVENANLRMKVVASCIYDRQLR